MSIARKLLEATALLSLTTLAQPAWSQLLEALTPEQRELLLQSRGQGGQLLGTKRSAASQVSAPVKPQAPTGPAPGFASHGELRPFGEALFSSTSATFVPPSDMPVPADYVIGVGDVVELRFFGKENKLYQLPVERNGTVTLPDMGPATVVGMTFEAMGKMLLERIAKQKIGVEATVSMGPLRSIQVFLMGDVNNPGAYTADGLTTVVNALLIGGGIKPTGSMRKVEIRRQGKVAARVDLYDALLKGADRSDLRLQSGDVIFVPSVGRRVAISGDILRPAIYELLSEKSADDLIRLAGGLLPTAYPAGAKLDRVGSDGRRQAVDTSLATPNQRKLELADGDVLTIPSVLVRWDKSVTLAGSVERGGNFEWKEGMHLGMLINSFNLLKRDAYRAFAVIERTDEATGQRNFLPVNLLSVVRGLKTEPLQPEDRIIVLGQPEVDFLSSASVQFVLAGRLPPASSSPQGGALVSETTGLTQEPDAAESLGSLDVARIGEILPAQSPQAAQAVQALAAQATQPAKPSGNYCQGLIELSDIVHREGADRFRSALLYSGGDSDKVRLVKAQPCPALFKENPTLLSFVLENAITVRGEVKQPGVLPVAAGLPLLAALNARGGLTREADTKGIEISRLDNVSGTQATLKRDVVGQQDALAKIALQPGDIILVKKRFTDQEAGLVRLSGEFAHPGTYEIRRGERLSDLITRAGGTSQVAYPYGAVFQRQAIKEEKKQYYQKAAQELQTSMIFAMTHQRATGAGGGEGGATPLILNLMKQLNSIDPSGRMVVEADPVVLQSRPEMDVVLEAGDEIHMPRRPSSIIVMGEVLNPGAVQFQSGKKAIDYINAVGGLTRLADEDRIYAILPNGSAEPLKISSWNLQPRLLPPGSVIYVSRELLPTTNTDLLMLSLQVLKDLALSAASLAVINK